MPILSATHRTRWSGWRVTWLTLEIPCAVTAYINRRQPIPNYVQRYVTFEIHHRYRRFRRAQNVMGLPALPGGAQLHSRENFVGHQRTDLQRHPGRRHVYDLPARSLAVSLNPTPSSMPKSPTTCLCCGSSGCAGRAATCRSRRSSVLWFNPPAASRYGLDAWGSCDLGSSDAGPSDHRRAGSGGRMAVDESLPWTLFCSFWIVAALVCICL